MRNRENEPKRVPETAEMCRNVPPCAYTAENAKTNPRHSGRFPKPGQSSAPRSAAPGCIPSYTAAPSSAPGLYVSLIPHPLPLSDPLRLEWNMTAPTVTGVQKV